MLLLEVKNLSKSYGNKRIIDRCSLELKKGEILGILGHNGAGKTTFLSMLIGLLKPSCGTIYYFGKNLQTHQSEILTQIGVASAYTELPATLTVWQNLDIFGRLYGLTAKERTERINTLLELLEIQQLRSQRTQYLSAGEMTRVIIAKAFLHQPKIVLLDEPTASLDVEISNKIRKFILQQQKKGTSFIITSHNMIDMTELCDKIAVLRKGKIVAEGTPQELTQLITINKLFLFSSAQELQKIVEFCQKNKLPFTLHINEIEIKIPTNKTADIIQKLTVEKIYYSNISIKEPTLEDFFLSLTEGDKQ